MNRYDSDSYNPWDMSNWTKHPGWVVKIENENTNQMRVLEVIEELPDTPLDSYPSYTTTSSS